MGKKKVEKKSKSGSPMTTLIVALISSIIFFLIGVEVGKEYVIREGIAPVREQVAHPLPGETSSAPPGASKRGAGEKVDINFYDQLMKEGDQELNEKSAERKKAKAEKRNAKPQSKRETAGSKREEPAKKKVEENRGAYALQVAAFREKNRAVRMAEMLRREGFTPHIFRVVIPGKPGSYYRLWVGYYRDITEAARAKRRMIQNHALKISRATIVKRQ